MEIEEFVNKMAAWRASVFQKVDAIEIPCLMRLLNVYFVSAVMQILSKIIGGYAADSLRHAIFMSN